MSKLDEESIKILLKGKPASLGRLRGKVRVILKEHDKLNLNVEDGEIVVIPFITPLDFQVITKAGAIVTDIGGVTSHAACIARELGIPCVVATEKATKLLKDGMEIIVDGKNGVIYQ